MEKELVSVRRDGLTLGRDREFRKIGLLVFPWLGNPPGLTIRINQIDGSGNGVYGCEFRARFPRKHQRHLFGIL